MYVFFFFGIKLLQSNKNNNWVFFFKRKNWVWIFDCLADKSLRESKRQGQRKIFHDLLVRVAILRIVIFIIVDKRYCNKIIITVHKFGCYIWKACKKWYIRKFYIFREKWLFFNLKNNYFNVIFNPCNKDATKWSNWYYTCFSKKKFDIIHVLSKKFWYYTWIIISLQKLL